MASYGLYTPAELKQFAKAHDNSRNFFKNKKLSAIQGESFIQQDIEQKKKIEDELKEKQPIKLLTYNMNEENQRLLNQKIKTAVEDVPDKTKASFLNIDERSFHELKSLDPMTDFEASQILSEIDVTDLDISFDEFSTPKAVVPETPKSHSQPETPKSQILETPKPESPKSQILEKSKLTREQEKDRKRFERNMNKDQTKFEIQQRSDGIYLGALEISQEVLANNRILYFPEKDQKFKYKVTDGLIDLLTLQTSDIKRKYKVSEKNPYTFVLTKDDYIAYSSLIDYVGLGSKAANNFKYKIGATMFDGQNTLEKSTDEVRELHNQSIELTLDDVKTAKVEESNNNLERIDFNEAEIKRNAILRQQLRTMRQIIAELSKARDKTELFTHATTQLELLKQTGIVSDTIYDGFREGIQKAANNQTL
jgi:hypothetical protein